MMWSAAAPSPRPPHRCRKFPMLFAPRWGPIRGGFRALTGTAGKCARMHLGCTPLIKSPRAFLGDMTVYSILNHELPRSLEPRACLALSPSFPPLTLIQHLRPVLCSRPHLKEQSVRLAL